MCVRKVDLLFPFLLLSLLLLDAIQSLMEVEDYEWRQEPVSGTISAARLRLTALKCSHRCGRDQKSSVVPPIPVILQSRCQISQHLSALTLMCRSLGRVRTYIHTRIDRHACTYRGNITFAFLKVLFGFLKQTWQVDHHSIPWTVK